MGADDLLGPGQNLVERHRGGIENDGVGGGLKRRFGAVAVAVVAFPEFGEDGGFGCAMLFGGLRIGCLTGGALPFGRQRADGSYLAVAAVAADLGCGVEKDFDLGVGEYGGADVAALHDHPTLLA